MNSTEFPLLKEMCSGSLSRAIVVTSAGVTNFRNMLRRVSLRSFNVGYRLRRSESGNSNNSCLQSIRFHCFWSFFDSALILACRASFSVRSYGDIFQYKNESNIMKLPAHHFALWLGHWECCPLLSYEFTYFIWVESELTVTFFPYITTVFFVFFVLWWWVWFLSVVKTKHGHWTSRVLWTKPIQNI